MSDLSPQGGAKRTFDRTAHSASDGRRQQLSSGSFLMLDRSGLNHPSATLEVERCARGVAGSHTLPVSRVINDLRATRH
jgi:hypothetical protein